MARTRAQAGLFDLMERYVEGDRCASNRLHVALSIRLRGFLRKLVHDEPACDDLFQLTMLKAHLARYRFRVPGGDPDAAVQTWYFVIARNVAMDFLRDRHRAKKRAAMSEGDRSGPVISLPDPSPTAQEHGEQREAEMAIIEEVRAAIAQLPLKLREVVELHRLKGMPMAEIAARLQVREGTLRVRAHRAYKARARLLQPRKQPRLGQDDPRTETERSPKTT